MILSDNEHFIFFVDRVFDTYCEGVWTQIEKDTGSKTHGAIMVSKLIRVSKQEFEEGSNYYVSEKQSKIMTKSQVEMFLRENMKYVFSLHLMYE